jgi:hypothetical protein
MYNCTLSLTSTLEGVGGQRHASAALPPGKNRYSLYRRMGAPQSRSGHVQKISPPKGFDPRIVQTVPHLLEVCYLKDVTQAH